MKVVLLSTFDSIGGAGRAAYRLHQGLLQQGLDSRMVVNKKFSGDATVIAPTVPMGKAIAQLRARLDQARLKLYPQRPDTYFSPQWLPDSLVKQVNQLRPDVVNVHWTQAGFMQAETLAKFNCPVVLTLHDMWAMTGGCHYSFDCDRYQAQCGRCPQLGSQNATDLSHRLWQRKSQSWQQMENLTLVTLCQWMGDCASKSSLLSRFPQRCIANGLDLTTYQPIDKAIAKAILGIPAHQLTLLFTAVQVDGDPRKGFSYLAQPLAQLAQTDLGDHLELLILGQQTNETESIGNMAVRSLGKLQDDLSLRMVYSAADVFVAPSLADNLPNTVVEAFACGTPTVAFDVGGLPDIIDHQRNGYLARFKDATDLCQGIYWVLTQDGQTLNQAARRKAQSHFELQQQVQKYVSLFETVTAQSGA